MIFYFSIPGKRQNYLGPVLFKNQSRMKRSRILVIIGVIGLWILLNQFLPNEEEREAAKFKEIGNRNFLEQQLVGKWNHTDFPAGMENDRNYHLLSADASYSYRGSDKSKSHGGKWSVRVTDSVLWLNVTPKTNSKVYKIKGIGPGHVLLQKIENDSLTTEIGWFRHP